MSDPLRDEADPLGRLAALEAPLRRGLYRQLAWSGEWTSRDRAAEIGEMPRSVAAFHLDKLVEAGLLECRYQRLGDRRGPGAGRPAKLYRAIVAEVSASVPGRRYDIAGSILAEAVTRSVRTGTSVTDTVRAAALERGRGVEVRSESLFDLLERFGYEPARTLDGEIALGNCPFHRLAVESRDVVCGMNLAFLMGLAEAAHEDPMRLVRREEAAPARCCVEVVAGGRPDY